jgi:Type I phosphodiesterase / nucleotide pyrophosphatase
MKIRKILVACAAAAFAASLPAAHVSAAHHSGKQIEHVLLISIDGMHALDLRNCINGVEGLSAYCPNLAKLAGQGVVYPQASTARPSDSYPGLVSIVTGGTPFSADIFYDDSYDRSYAPPASPNNRINDGAVGGSCSSGTPGPGTEILYDESLDNNWDPGLSNSTSINASLKELNMARDPKHGCKPVYPHSLLKVNTIFEVIKSEGGYTAWSDKHPAYDLVNGPSGKGVDDLFTPEINSIVGSGIPGVSVGHVKCSPAPDSNVDPAMTNWTQSFANIQCYDQYRSTRFSTRSTAETTRERTRPACLPFWV